MDRRTKRTHRLLGDALIDLLQERDLHQISIRDITDEADVAYSTFFRNFESIEALLLARLNQFIEALMKEMSPQRDAPYQIQSRMTITAIFKYVRDEPKLPRVLFQKPAAQPVLKQFKALQVANNINQLKQINIRQEVMAIPLDLLIGNVVAQLFNMIDWYLTQTNPPKPDEMSLYYEQIVLRPMWTLLVGTEQMQMLLPEGVD